MPMNMGYNEGSQFRSGYTEAPYSRREFYNDPEYVPAPLSSLRSVPSWNDPRSSSAYMDSMDRLRERSNHISPAVLSESTPRTVISEPSIPLIPPSLL